MATRVWNECLECKHVWEDTSGIRHKPGDVVYCPYCNADRVVVRVTWWQQTVRWWQVKIVGWLQRFNSWLWGRQGGKGGGGQPCGCAVLLMLLLGCILAYGIYYLIVSVAPMVGSALTAFGNGVIWLLTILLAFLMPLALGVLLVLIVVVLLHLAPGIGVDEESSTDQIAQAVTDFEESRGDQSPTHAEISQLLDNLRRAYDLPPGSNPTAVAAEVAVQNYQRAERQRNWTGALIIALTILALFCFNEAKTLETIRAFFGEIVRLGSLNLLFFAIIFATVQKLRETSELGDQAGWAKRLVAAISFGVATVATSVFLPSALGTQSFSKSVVSTQLAQNIVFDVIVVFYSAAVARFLRQQRGQLQS